MLLRRLFATFIVTTTLSPLHAGFLTNGSLNGHHSRRQRCHRQRRVRRNRVFSTRGLYF
jgi:hypothetical protein